MSLLGKAAKALKRVGKVALKVAKPIIGMTPLGLGVTAGGAAGSLLGAAMRKTTTSAMVRALPGAGLAVGGGYAGAAIEQHMAASGYTKRRRRRKGISGKDLSSFKRVARLIDKFAAPVHRLKKAAFKTCK